MGDTMEIEVEPYRLRPFADSDCDAIVEIANDREVSRNLTDLFPFPYSDVDAAEWVAICSAEGEPTRNFAIEVDGLLAGGAGLRVLVDERAGSGIIGYWLGRKYWGRGVASAVVPALRDYAFDTFELDRLEARVFGWNPASARVLEKAGFQLEGRLRRAVIKDGDHTDLLLYGLLRSET